MRVQGWDPVLIISQIICLQAIHYLTMTLVVPPLLSGFTAPALLEYSGGPQTVAHVMDWREMAARPTVPNSNAGVAGAAWRRLGAWAGGKKVGQSDDDREGDGDRADEPEEGWDYGVDGRRGWVIGGAWILASVVDIAPLYYLIRRPTHILDFSLTLTFVHLILTTYYAKAFPTSLFFWVVQALSAIVMIVVGEQLCVKREMNSDLDIAWSSHADGDGEVIELNDR